ncbi:helix-turn-helix domain-containing protein [Pedobacter sp. GR22-6]|uniref:helix-turn-helix domain-containing protein n=1 Tax=Pedobacter sp. GR22-6 TaxID=3127957 RepID=UPI00307DA901
MAIERRKIDLFGKQFIQKLVFDEDFQYDYPVSEQACFLYMLDGGIRFQFGEDSLDIPVHYSLMLNCLSGGKRIQNSETDAKAEVVIVTFHRDILQKIYEKELPELLQKPKNIVSNLSNERINSDFLIHKYIEGLLFYFENPTLVNEDILILKLKEIILLLSQTKDAGNIQVILSQLYSPTTYSFKQIIEANIFEPASIDELARKANLSVSSFKREFTKVYNDSPANYIRTKRLEKAADLLRISDKRISDIAFSCGFHDLANFTKSFHDKYETSPSNYRLEHK